MFYPTKLPARGFWLLLAMFCFAQAGGAQNVLVEAEAFEKVGGWSVDQQFMDQMGSPFLLAHGLGEPVKDATTTMQFPAAGKYRVWVRTRDWVAPWKAPGAPGKFQVLIDGKPLGTIFGTEGADWHWQDGGTIEVPNNRIALALHDMTGFEGRCDAILFCMDVNFAPPDQGKTLAELRKKLLNLPEKPEDAGEYDLVVVGGGIAGTCAALTGARLGLKVALIQDRPVLGGNNSSEVRVWLNGTVNHEPYPRVGDVTRELEPKLRAALGPAEIYEDDKRLELVRSEKNLTVLTGFRANQVECSGSSIGAVMAQTITSGKRVRVVGRWFADCTGDGMIGVLGGADHENMPKGHMGASNLWGPADTGKATAFPRCPWALDLHDKPFPGRYENDDQKAAAKLGVWYWESGFNRDPFSELEVVRDTNLRAMYGAWDALKNVDGKFANWKLKWAGFIAGPRESRQLLGDVILSKEDLLSSKVFPDGCFPTTWSMDVHIPDEKYVKGFESDPFISKALFGQFKRPYWVPYRTLYSRNVSNLFMAGRDISVSRDALGTIRVMRTGGMMGEVVGMAASICKKHNTNPRGVYAEHLQELLLLMKQGVGKP